MIHVDANAALGAAFRKSKLGAWDVVDSSLGFAADAGAVTEGIVSGAYDYFVPIVAIGVVAFALLGEGD